MPTPKALVKSVGATPPELDDSADNLRRAHEHDEEKRRRKAEAAGKSYTPRTFDEASAARKVSESFKAYNATKGK